MSKTVKKKMIILLSSYVTTYNHSAALRERQTDREKESEREKERQKERQRERERERVGTR